MKKTYRIANRFRFTVFVVLTIIVITTAFNFTLGFNTADSLTIQNYADIEVSYGDTLWSIAGNYISHSQTSNCQGRNSGKVTPDSGRSWPNLY